MSIAPDQINLNILKNDNDQVQDKLTITEDSFYPFLGKYTGSIIIQAENFSPKKIPVEYEMYWNPLVLMIITLVGLFVAFVFDITIFQIDKKEKEVKKSAEILDLIRHINRHVEVWNQYELEKNSKSRMEEFHNHHLKIAEGGMTLMEAKEILEHYHYARNWVETDEKGVPMKLDLFNESIKNEKPKSKPSNAEIKKDKDEKALRKRLSAITIIVTSLTAVPATLWAVTYFPNHLILDGILAGLIGFGIYSSKEIGKKLRDKGVF